MGEKNPKRIKTMGKKRVVDDDIFMNDLKVLILLINTVIYR